jgi:hypothetical protein
MVCGLFHANIDDTKNVNIICHGPIGIQGSQ